MLVVEDTRDLRELLVEILEAEGYRVDAATNGAEALQRLDREPRVDVVLLDLMMPVMDGLEVLEHLKRQPQPSAPVVAMSAFERLRHEARGLGACAVVGKPVDIEHLLGAIERHAAAHVAG